MESTQTLQHMQSLRLHGMRRALENLIETRQWQKLETGQVLQLLLQSEYDERHNRKITRLTHAARFRYQANIEEVEYKEDRNLSKAQLADLSACTWVRNAENLIICGSTGVGKSFLASALGHHACRNNYRVAYFNTQKLFQKLALSRLDGTRHKEISRIGKMDLLVLDDFGLHTLDDTQRMDLLEIIEDRHGKQSTLITSQLPVKNWYDVIGEPTLADAIMDRILNQAIRIELKGESLRKKK